MEQPPPSGSRASRRPDRRAPSSGAQTDSGGLRARARRVSRRKRRRRGHRRLRRIVALATVLSAVLTSGGAGGLVLVSQDPAVVPGCKRRAEPARFLCRPSFLSARDASPLGAVPTTHNREPVTLARMSP